MKAKSRLLLMIAIAAILMTVLTQPTLAYNTAIGKVTNVVTSGGAVNLNVILDVPPELDNTYQQQIGLLDWEFMIEEYETDPSDPQPPQTGDDLQIWVRLGMLLLSLYALIMLILLWKRIKKK